jgi:UTP--glucose-1-phosphate uridylyltransferase
VERNHIDEESEGSMNVRKAVIPAAGLGTRFLPATKALPKEMLPIVDKPVIQYVVEEAVESGITQVVVITSQSKRAMEDHFDANVELEARLASMGRDEDLAMIQRVSDMAEFAYVRQKHPQGNGHAVLCAWPVVGDEPFAMIWGDDIVAADPPCLRQMIDAYERHGGAVAAVMRVPDADVPKYGVIDGEQVSDRVYRLRSIVEKPPLNQAPSNLATVHAWILPPRIFPLLAATPPGKDGEIWLVDAIAALIKEQPIFALEFEGRRYDAGNKLEYLQASIDFALQRPDLAESLRAYLADIVDATRAATQAG